MFFYKNREIQQFPFAILAYSSSGIIGEHISERSAASISPFSAYSFPARFMSSSLGTVTGAASGALNIGRSGTAMNFGNLRLQKRFFRGKNYFSSHSLSFLIPSLLPER